MYLRGVYKNSRQEDALIEFMQNHLDLARLFTRSDKIDVENLWKDLVKELNSLGPPIHDLTNASMAYPESANNQDPISPFSCLDS